MSGKYGKKRFFKHFIDRARKANSHKDLLEQREKHQIVKRESESRSVENRKQNDNIISNEPESLNKEKSKVVSDLYRSLCATVTTVAILASVAVTGYALYTSRRLPTEEGAQDSGTESISDEDKKVIFIREHDSESGALTPSEIYEKCKTSVVTVLCEDSATNGSGFVCSADGYIVTAAHVVDGSRTIYVVTSDKRQYTAKLVQADSKTDVALLKIEASGMSYVEFGKSSELLVGESVYSIGTPASADYAGSFCSGEITYMDRVLSVYDNMGALEKKMTVIQTNAILNSGNSGSPLFDIYGRVVGMVTMKLGGEYNGIGFALPGDGVSQIISAMVNDETVGESVVTSFVTFPPKLGISGETVSKDGKYGYLISSFSECGSNVGAVLREGDMIVAIDEKEVARYSEITEIINRKNPKDTVKVTVVRNGQDLTFDVILGQ